MAANKPISRSSSLYSNVKFDKVLECIHCGLCLDACPTYRELGTEQDSPRGRLDLMRGMWEGKLQPTAQVREPLARCLDCRACESACPSNVAYGELLEKTRGLLTEKVPRNPMTGRMQRWLFDAVLGRAWAMVVFSKLAKIYQTAGLPNLFRSKMLRRMLPRRMVMAHKVMPRFEGQSFKTKWKAGKAGAAGRRVSLFTGCVMDVADHEIHRASVALLEAAGFAVSIPQEQGCCGALHAHRGFLSGARKLARTNLEVFPPGKYYAVIVNAAGCGAQLKSLAHLFEGETGEAAATWKDWARQVNDLLMFLAEAEDFAKTRFVASPQVTVLYDAPCHLIHAQRSDRGARQLLSDLPGVTLVPLKDAERCCGAAGIYNLTQPELAGDILEKKLDDIESCLQEHPEATLLLTANPGCLYQLRAGVADRGLPIEVQHPAVFSSRRLIVREFTD